MRFVHLSLIGCAVIALFPTRASAIPAFARKYETSCETCHTVYPRLNPFGEAFRRNGYRFPGVDSDMVKQNTISLGQDAYKDTFPNSVWPDSIPGTFPVSFGINGQAVVHPDTHSSGGAADNNTTLNLSQIVQEGHIWGGGSFSDTTTFFTEVTLTKDGVDIEHARVHFNDLIGPAHAVNLWVGRGFQTISSFGTHSSYASDQRILAAPVASLYGATTDTWNVGGQYNGLEVNGVIGGAFDYSLGVNAGAHVSARPSENVYGHVGYKIGGMSLDGENSKPDPDEPWAETSLTVDLFGAHTNTHFMNSAMTEQGDKATTYGGGLRGQWRSLELDAGLYRDDHTHALADGTGAVALVHYDELSYMIFPWLVPAVRFEFVHLTTDTTAMNNYKIIPAVAMAIRPNVKLTVIGQIESAEGMPAGGWGAINGLATPSSPTGVVKAEVESVMAVFAFAF